jgi:phosphopentomutase
MPRAFVMVMDSFGIGGQPRRGRLWRCGRGYVRPYRRRSVGGRPRAAPAQSCTAGLGRRGDGEHGPVACRDFRRRRSPGGLGYAAERSCGKDTPSGHWEMAGCPVESDWGYFPVANRCFPVALIEELVAEARLPGVMGNCHASGTAVIEELGARHMESGEPIIYTSADSVFQIAAHEETFGLERLMSICVIARRLVDRYSIARVIARPFAGTPGSFRRTAHRRDWAVPPPGPTLLDVHEAAGGSTISIGKVGDIFAHRATGREIKADGNAAIFDALIEVARTAEDRALVLANFVDFDTLYGHRCDLRGYAAALEAFDARIPVFRSCLRDGEVAVVTADHGCDPTWRGSDHTREHVPVLAFGPGVVPRELGRRESFADIGQSIAASSTSRRSLTGPPASIRVDGVLRLAVFGASAAEQSYRLVIAVQGPDIDIGAAGADAARAAALGEIGVDERADIFIGALARDPQPVRIV